LGHYGCRCQACKFDFGESYGPAFADFIHVHHLKPLRHGKTPRRIDPVRDLRPICPNCHAVAHLQRPGAPRSVSEIRELLETAPKRGRRPTSGCS
jgi:5-methylcytosine-specific restriction protein A